MTLPDLPDDIERELQEVGNAVLEALNHSPRAKSIEAELLEAVRTLASELTIEAGAGDRFDDFGALSTIVTMVLTRAAGSGAFLDHEEERDDPSE